VNKLIAENKRLSATVRRLRRNIRQIYLTTEPLDGPWATDGGTGESQAAHHAELKKMLR
jgi:hypothetical protein